MGHGRIVPSYDTNQSEVRWQPLCHYYVKINVDASWVAALDDGFIGMVVWDSLGAFIATRKLYISASTIMVAEAFAILQGCEFGQSLGLTKVIVESDLFHSISCLKGKITNDR